MFRIDIGKGTPGALAVELDDRDDGYAGTRTWTLQVDPKWQPPLIRQVVPTIERVDTKWTCSHELSQTLKFSSSASGYRVVLKSAADAAGQEATPSVYLPSSVMMFFYDPPKSVPVAKLGLGYLDCFGETFDFQGKTVWAEIHALLPDGSEPLVTPTPLKVSSPYRASNPWRSVP